MEFLRIMEDGIRTFMNFLKADKESHCKIFTDLFKRNRRIRVDPILLHFMKKTNTKKKKKIKDLYRASKCFRKKRLKEEDEMQILMCLIDLKVVSRVLKMSDISDEQLNWCEEKMSKVKVLEGKVLQRDSSPLFFPTH
ncbi:Dna ligase [Thalictrum thalictroides]|uniref:Dna ligase n=1 Tax=Thalictrum thalictroides TaxID=46969 RepID=A0A7J6WWE6_THATH|nr:Dna ligase [Thalictrum thalictroides]